MSAELLFQGAAGDVPFAMCGREALSSLFAALVGLEFNLGDRGSCV